MLATTSRACRSLKSSRFIYCGSPVMVTPQRRTRDAKTCQPLSARREAGPSGQAGNLSIPCTARPEIATNGPRTSACVDCASSVGVEFPGDRSPALPAAEKGSHAAPPAPSQQMEPSRHGRPWGPSQRSLQRRHGEDSGASRRRRLTRHNRDGARRCP